MCLGGSSEPAAQAPAPPPPPPIDAPASPAFNEDTTNSANASDAVSGARRGRKSLRVDLNTSGTSQASSATQQSTGLSIPS